MKTSNMADNNYVKHINCNVTNRPVTSAKRDDELRISSTWEVGHRTYTCSQNYFHHWIAEVAEVNNWCREYTMPRIIECVPNFSEGRSKEVGNSFLMTKSSIIHPSKQTKFNFSIFTPPSCTNTLGMPAL